MAKVILAIIIFISLILRIQFPSPWLEDWDSVNFALGMQHFSIIDHQPHPPGYLFYILVAKFVNLLLHDSTKSLTGLSVICGVLSILMTFYLVKKMFDYKTALLASSLLTILPIHWILSEVALSNIPGLFFLIIIAFLIYSSNRSIKSLFLIGTLTGVSLGIRATELPIHISLLLLLALKTKNIKSSIFLFLSFIFGIGLWLIPTILLTGPEKFFEAYSSLAKYVIWHDTLQGQSTSIISLLKSRFKSLLYLSEISFTPFFLITILPAVFWALKRRLFLNDFRYQFLGSWLVVYLFLLLFFYNLELPKYTLAITPPLVIFSSLSFFLLLKKLQGLQKLFPVILYVFIFIGIFNHSFWAVKYQAENTPPTIDPVIFVNENLNPSETTIITTYTYRQFQYYAPNFKNYYGVENAPSSINSKYVVIDYKELKNQIPALADYIVTDKKHYSGSLPFLKIREIDIYTLERNI